MAESEEIITEEPKLDNPSNEEEPNEVAENQTGSKETPAHESEPPADNDQNWPKENETATPQEALESEEVASSDIKNETNEMTAELTANSNVKESLEIAVVPKVSERQHSNGKHARQSVMKNKAFRVSTPVIELLEVSEDQTKKETPESQGKALADNTDETKTEKGASTTPQENTLPEIGKNVIKMENNIVTVELSVNENSKELPEIGAVPKVADSHHSMNGNHMRQKPLKVSTPKYYPLSSEKTPTPVKTSNTSTFYIHAKNFAKPVKRFIIYAILSTIFVGYTIGGAYLFSHLEKQREMEYNVKIDKWKNDTAILLATELRQVAPYEPVWARKVFHYLEVYEKDLLKASSVGYRRLDDKDRDQRWTWTSSLLFSISLMTTTGYGSMTPRSKLGRTSTVVYSLFGIPLAICWFMVTGRILAIGFTSIFRTVCCSTCGGDESLKLNTITSESHGRTHKKPGRFRSNSVAPVDEQILIPHSNYHLNRYSHKTNLAKSGDIPNSQLRPKSAAVPDCQNAYCLAARVYFEKHSFETGNTFRMIDFTMALVYSLLFFVVFFAFCSVTFAMHEEWELTDMFFFNYLMLVTVGPGCHELENESLEIRLKNNPRFLMFVVPAYCLLSMIVNLVYLMLTEKRTRHKGELKWKAFNGRY